MIPPIKWPGGKRKFVDTFRELWAPHRDRVLVEPFCGACAVGLGVEASMAVMNDFNPHVVNFFWFLQDGGYITLDMENDRNMYYQYRGRFNKLIQQDLFLTDAAAELFYYLNKTGYNGLFRVNKSGMFNVPFGKYKEINYVRDLTGYKDLIGDWTFTYGDFEDTPLPKTPYFIYADPPYDDGFDAYTADGFSWKDQVRLADWLTRLNCPVVASNKATTRIVSLYQGHGFDIQYINGPRSISSDGNRDSVLEIVATRNL